MTKVEEINSSEFESQVEQNPGFVLVDFFAQWCGPCKIISPIIEQIANEFTTLKVVKIDADNAQEIMRKFAIRGIPTLLLFKEGKVIATKVGALTHTQLRDFVTSHSN